MAKRRKEKASVPTADDSKKGMVNPFAAAFERRGVDAAPASSPSAVEPPAQPARQETDEPLAAQKKIVLRRTRKGRGGRTVTLVQGLSLSDDARRDLARELGRAMGCGAKVEGEEIIMQGDQADRAEPWLLSRGVHRIVRGN
jgi:translation initiation factor 1